MYPQVTGGFTFRVYEWQAVAVARLLAGRAALPSREVQREWELERLRERGEGKPFFTLAPDYEQYFEALRSIAGEPAPGTSGRSLPKFDPSWLEHFASTVASRIAWWKSEAARAATPTRVEGEALQLRAKL